MLKDDYDESMMEADREDNVVVKIILDDDEDR